MALPIAYDAKYVFPTVRSDDFADIFRSSDSWNTFCPFAVRFLTVNVDRFVSHHFDQQALGF